MQRRACCKRKASLWPWPPSAKQPHQAQAAATALCARAHKHAPLVVVSPGRVRARPLRDARLYRAREPFAAPLTHVRRRLRQQRVRCERQSEAGRLRLWLSAGTLPRRRVQARAGAMPHLWLFDALLVDEDHARAAKVARSAVDSMLVCTPSSSCTEHSACCWRAQTEPQSDR